ncbi:kinase-like domain-containing protein [Kickxella alabastrina]|uniref:kinase-like domain-containing protein n=1 Tax=Kickxella alabastrina TaxID=61397 RepID=UPI0022200D0B|nr:kinase-like domain-containing protein [Kickxella alabastrina]KAI7834746.1 kinase-like domain-containing protein [Kickxella alabastrina]KAJ1947449.1 putative serine/threonine-protein kinase iks1 [Kickxella alabastrina]
MYNQDNNEVELRHIVPRGLGLPRSPHRLGQTSSALTVSAPNNHSSVNIHVEDAHICPTCLQIMPAHATTTPWRPLTSPEASLDTMATTTADREYFEFLARSLRPRQPTLALEGKGGYRRPPTAVRRSLRMPTDRAGFEGSDAGYNISHSDLEDSMRVPSMASDNDDDNPISGGSSPESTAAASGVSANSFNQGYYERFFTEQNKLGKGLRGSVFSCQHILDGVYLGHYAVKKVAVGNNHQWLRRMLREVKLLESLRHHNVVEYKHSWLEMHQLTSFGPNVPCLFILMEYANGGNLQEFMEPKAFAAGTGSSTMSWKQKILQQRRQSRIEGGVSAPAKPDTAPGASQTNQRMLTINQIRSLFADICNGLAHLHQLKIIHRDLKHMNLLLQWKDPDNKETSGEIPRIMLTDFGECEDLSHLEKRDRTGATGTLEFMAPELLMVDSTGRFLDSYSTKSDMWSLGMVLYYLCYSRLPYIDIDDFDRLRSDVLRFRNVDFSETQRPGGAEDIPLDLRQIMQQLLDHNEDRRPDVGEVIRKINEHEDLCRSRARDDSRFELQDLNMTSSFGGDTSGIQTPQPRATEKAPKHKVTAADSQALIISPQPHTLGTFSDHMQMRAPPSADTRISEIFRRHSADGSSCASSRPQSPDRHGYSSTPSSDECWADFEEPAPGVAASKGISVNSETDMLHSEPSQKRDRTDAKTPDVPSAKRPRSTPPRLIAEASAVNIDPAFCAKTAILLAKMYALQIMVGGNTADRSECSATMPALTGLTLVLSALDIHQHSSLQLSLILLLVNICVVYLGLYL